MVSRRGPTTSSPSTVIVPRVGFCRPAISSSSVVLPQPVGQTSAVNVPDSSFKSTYSSTRCSPKSRHKSSMRISGIGRDRASAARLPPQHPPPDQQEHPVETKTQESDRDEPCHHELHLEFLLAEDHQRSKPRIDAGHLSRED